MRRPRVYMTVPDELRCTETVGMPDGSSHRCIRYKRGPNFCKQHSSVKRRAAPEPILVDTLMSTTKEYQAWRDMIRRCYDPSHASYLHYSGKGITVCDRWRDSMHAFMSDMGKSPPGLTLERIDNSLGYRPENCEWATMAAQNRNKNRGNLSFVDYKGNKLTLTECAAASGLTVSCLRYRLKHGWDVELACATPPKRTSRAASLAGAGGGEK